MRVEETFSRFRHSFTFQVPDRDFEIGLRSVGPGLNLDKGEGIPVNGDYINFPAPCPPVARDNPVSAPGKLERGLILPRPPGFDGGSGGRGAGYRGLFGGGSAHFAFWYSWGSIARAMNMVWFCMRSTTSPSFWV